MRKEFEEYRDTGILGSYHPEMAVLREQTAALRESGSVLALRQKPENIKYRRLLKLRGSEVAELENNA